MGNSVPSRSGMSEIGLRVAMAALVLAVVLMPGLAVAQSAQKPAYSFKVLYDFCSLAYCPDGAIPWAALIEDSAGNLYGTTFTGGGSSGGGVVFKVNKNGRETVLSALSGGSGGANPYGAGVVRDPAGNLYGTTEYGGDLSCEAPYGCGVVFKVDTADNETVLHSFQGGTDGMRPCAGLIRDSAGNLYGTTAYGGSTSDCGDTGWGCGTVFKLDTAGNETVLHSFDDGADYGVPQGGLVMDAKGNLYGTTYGNGTDNPGTVYKVTKTGTETVLYTFKTGSDGSAPMGSLIMDTKGNLYGTTSGNNGDSNGTVFRLTKSGKETVLWRFQGAPDGREPQAGVVMDAAGNLYGTTLIGGTESPPTCQPSNGCGTVFKVTEKGNETILYRFKGESDGGFPRAGLFLDTKGNLYGTTPYGGYSNYCPYQGEGCGVVFKLTPR